MESESERERERGARSNVRDGGAWCLESRCVPAVYGPWSHTRGSPCSVASPTRRLSRRQNRRCPQKSAPRPNVVFLPSAQSLTKSPIGGRKPGRRTRNRNRQGG